MDQTTESFLRIEAVFHEALAAREEVREELIRSQCGGDAALIEEVRSLLEACQAEERVTALRLQEPQNGEGNHPAHQRVGPYEIDRLLGRGGMGAVYLAHRADGQFEQKVAIKLIDLPLATALFRERFRQERQILAELQHPFIARLLGGGVTAGGDPYLVMEYVDGVPIHRFCEERRLSTPERLALFMRVCEAVQFAHQNFIVHRDLKPDNILVAEDGSPRLLDFGTAKLLSPSLVRPGGELTREGCQSFTPQYASPEQVLGNPITTASDTYSLGVLLYLLLTGTQPYELKEMTTAEMLRVICEEAPRRPSQAAGSNKRLDADLEAILLKALRKEPRERYLTAEQMASDVRAYLEGQPVGARQGTLRYRASKFIRRNRLALAGTAALAVTLIAGVAGVLWQAKVANEERRKAEARSADLRQLSNSLLSELDEAIKQLPGSTGAQKLLVTRVLEHLDRMAKDAQGDRQTKLDLIDAYTRLGNIQGNAYDQNLGDPTGAFVSLGKALDLARPLAASGSMDREATRALALAEQSRSEILWQTGKTPEAVSVMRDAVKSYDVLAADPHATAALLAEVAGAHGTLADELGQPGTQSLGDGPGAIVEYGKDLSLTIRGLSIDPSLMRAKRALIIAPLKIANVEMETDPAQALKDFRIALQRVDALPQAEQVNLATTRLRTILVRKEANALVQLGEYSEANALFAEIYPSFQRFVAADPQDLRALEDLQVLLDDEAVGYEAAADPALAVAGSSPRANLAAEEDLLAQQIAILKEMFKQDPSNESWKMLQANAQVRLATTQSILRIPGDSNALAKAGLAVMRNSAKKDQASPLTLEQAAENFLKVEPASLRDPQFAVSCAERAVALSHRKVPVKLLTLAQAYRASGQVGKSRATAREGLALLPATQPGSVKPRLRKLLEIQMQTAA
jgi:tetratricopeptide (TPR) repeat protein